MEIRYYGANCVKIQAKKIAIVIDDTPNKGKSITTDKDIVLKTNVYMPTNSGGYFTIDTPGEYEISEVSVTAIASKLHIDENQSSSIFSVHVDGFSIAVIGHVAGSAVTEEQLEALGVVDILLIPVGGNGYTLDTVAAVKLVKDIEPKIVIPTHYAEKGTNYEVPQAPIDEFLKALGASDIAPIDSLKLKDPALLSEKTEVVLLNKQ